MTLSLVIKGASRVNQVITKASAQGSGDPQYYQFSIPASGGAQWVSVSLGYRRSADFDRANQPGQDYAIVRGGYGSVVGVVADGVSQSFYGHYAAEFVAERLLEYLWERRKAPPSAHQLNRILRDFERVFKTRIDNYVLPTRLQPLQRDALEQTRRQAGSQAVFAAFVLDTEARSLRLFEVGDALAVVHCARGETNGSHSKVIQADRRGRWSSAGRTHLLLEEINERDVKGIVIKSDGAKDWGASLASHKFNRAAFFEVAPEFACYDDVSFVAAVFQDERSEEISAIVGEGFNQSPPPVMIIPIDPAPTPHSPAPSSLPPEIYTHGPKPAKRRRDWKSFAFGSGAGFLLAAVGLLGLLWGKVVTFKPNAPACKVTVSKIPVPVEAAGTTMELDVSADENCKWSVTRVPLWIRINSPHEQSGNGRLVFSVSQNTGPEREESFEVGGSTLLVKQVANINGPSSSPDSERVNKTQENGSKNTQATAEQKPAQKSAERPAAAKKKTEKPAPVKKNAERPGPAKIKATDPPGTSQGQRQPETQK
jgi:hypothetical protein